MKLKDKVAIVTGAGQGIGRGVARVFAAEGAKVVIATLLEEEGRETESLIKKAGGEALTLQTDVSDETSVAAMVAAAANRCDAVDILVNNAGITVFKPLFEATLEDWERVINTNLRGVFLCSKHVGLVMQKQGGSIVNISSNHDLATLPNAELYAASKGGINAMTRALALSLRAYGIRVNAIMPGFTTTPHFYRWLGDAADRGELEPEVLGLHASEHLTSPEDVGHLAVYLASDDAKAMTGAELLLHNGLAARLYKSTVL